MNNHGRWRAEIQFQRGRSVLVQSEQISPLKVAKPFLSPSGGLMIYLMDCSPGLFGGDTQHLECYLKAGASLYLTTQSACKLHPSTSEGCSRQVQKFHIQAEALLEYFPEPLVPLAGADHEGETEIWLTHGAQAIFGEVISAGRVGRGELFQYRRLVSRLSVYWEGTLTVFDPLQLQPEQGDETKNTFAGYTHLATLWVLSERAGEEEVTALRGLLSSSRGAGRIYGGCSRLPYGGVVLRALGSSAWELQDLLYQCWTLLRGRMFHQPALKVRK